MPPLGLAAARPGSGESGFRPMRASAARVLLSTSGGCTRLGLLRRMQESAPAVGEVQGGKEA